jgi:spore coat polysaccharide biosynthesis protein SpsF
LALRWEPAMVFAVIVQARMNSTRLRGKALELVGRKTALQRCLSRAMRIDGVDEIVCAVPQGSENNAVADEAARSGARIVRGPEKDVLARYGMAARAVRADVVMRLTSDCPLADPGLASTLYHRFVADQPRYGSNNLVITFPHGLDCEIFSADALYAAEAKTFDAYDREHVTPFLRRTHDGCQLSMEWGGAPVCDLRWTLDYPEDLAFFRALFALAGEEVAEMNWLEIAAFCRQHPQLQEFNACRRDPSRLAQSGKDRACHAVTIAVAA